MQESSISREPCQLLSENPPCGAKSTATARTDPHGPSLPSSTSYSPPLQLLLLQGPPNNRVVKTKSLGVMQHDFLAVKSSAYRSSRRFGCPPRPLGPDQW